MRGELLTLKIVKRSVSLPLLRSHGAVQGGRKPLTQTLMVSYEDLFLPHDLFKDNRPATYKILMSIKS